MFTSSAIPIAQNQVLGVRQLCTKLGFDKGSTDRPPAHLRESTQRWRKQYVSRSGALGKDLTEWKSQEVQIELYRMAEAFLEKKSGVSYWPARGNAASVPALEYPRDKEILIELLKQLFWQQNSNEVHNSHYPSRSRSSRDSNSIERGSATLYTSPPTAHPQEFIFANPYQPQSTPLLLSSSPTWPLKPNTGNERPLRSNYLASESSTWNFTGQSLKQVVDYDPGVQQTRPSLIVTLKCNKLEFRQLQKDMEIHVGRKAPEAVMLSPDRSSHVSHPRTFLAKERSASRSVSLVDTIGTTDSHQDGNDAGYAPIRSPKRQRTSQKSKMPIDKLRPGTRSGQHPDRAGKRLPRKETVSNTAQNPSPGTAGLIQYQESQYEEPIEIDASRSSATNDKPVSNVDTEDPTDAPDINTTEQTSKEYSQSSLNSGAGEHIESNRLQTSSNHPTDDCFDLHTSSNHNAEEQAEPAVPWSSPVYDGPYRLEKTDERQDQLPVSNHNAPEQTSIEPIYSSLSRNGGDLSLFPFPSTREQDHTQQHRSSPNDEASGCASEEIDRPSLRQSVVEQSKKADLQASSDERSINQTGNEHRRSSWAQNSPQHDGTFGSFLKSTPEFRSQHIQQRSSATDTCRGISTDAPMASNLPSVQPYASQVLSDRQTYPISKQGVPIRYFIVTSRYPRLVMKHWPQGSLRQKSLEDVFNEVSRFISKESIQRIDFVLSTSQREVHYSICKNDEEDFKNMRDYFVKAIRADALLNKEATAQISLEPDPLEQGIKAVEDEGFDIDVGI